MRDIIIDIEYSQDGGKTWRTTQASTTSQIGHALTKGGRAILHQIDSSYRLPKVA